MKANKFFAAAMAVMMTLGFVACDKKEGNNAEKKLSLDKSSISVKVGETKTLTANMPAEFSVDDATVVELIPGKDSKSIKIKGLKAGKAIVSVEADDMIKKCNVTVTEAGQIGGGDDVDYSEFKQLQGKEYYIFFLQGGAQDYLGKKVIYYFGPNDHEGAGSRWIYMWGDQTFMGGQAVGADPFDGGEGWTSVVQNPATGWSGMGLCVAIIGDNNPTEENAPEDLEALNDIKNHITDYSEWYLAIAAKNTVQGASYSVSLIGSNMNDQEAGVGKFTYAPKATGEWDYKEICLADLPGLEFGDWNHNGSNLLTVVAEPYIPGTQLDLGYVFLYKK